MPADPQHDIFQALIHWVEFGVPPDQIVATKYVNDTPPNVAFTRPLCVFPKIAKFKGGGSNPNDAANWTCVEGLVNDTTEDADEVLRDRGDRDRDDRPGK